MMDSIFYQLTKKSRFQTGSALVTLLVLVAVGMIVTTSAVVVAVTTTQTTAQLQNGELALSVAEAGIDEGLMNLLRSTSYTGSIVDVGTGTATVTVTGGSNPVIVSRGQVGTMIRTVQVTTTIVGQVVSVQSWQEI